MFIYRVFPKNVRKGFLAEDIYSLQQAEIHWTIGSDTVYYRFRYRPTDLNTWNTYIIFHVLQDCIAVTTFYIVLYWALNMKQCVLNVIMLQIFVLM